MQTEYPPAFVFGASQPVHTQFNFGGMYAQSTFTDQQTLDTNGGYSFSGELFNNFPLSSSQPSFFTGTPYPVGQYLAPEVSSTMPHGSFGVDVGFNLPADGHFPQGVVDNQVYFPNAGFLPEPPMIAPPQSEFTFWPGGFAPEAAFAPQLFSAPQPDLAHQPAFAPQVTGVPQALPTSAPVPTPAPQAPLAPQAAPIIQPIIAPQPPQALSAAEAPLDNKTIIQEAERARKLLVLFRLNQVHNPLLRKPKLLPAEKLNLELGVMEEYQAIVQDGIPLFVFEPKDWSLAMGFLDANSFLMFWKQELQIAQREGRSLPPLRQGLATYFSNSPPYEAIENRLQQLLDGA